MVDERKLAKNATRKGEPAHCKSPAAQVTSFASKTYDNRWAGLRPETSSGQ